MYCSGQLQCDEAPLVGQEHLTPSNAQSTSSDGYDESSPDSYENIPATEAQPAYQYTRDFQFQPRSGFPGMVGPSAMPVTFPSTTATNKRCLPPGDEGHDRRIDNTRPEISLEAEPRTHQSRYETDESNDHGGENAELKRKTQNRAAQRAHRERKEQHVKHLKAALKRLEETQVNTALENKRLKNDLEEKTIENKVLKATASTSSDAGTEHLVVGSPPQLSLGVFVSSVLRDHDENSEGHKTASPRGQRPLSPSAAWDYVVEHELYKLGAISMARLGPRLRRYAKCDGKGPVFYVSDINKAIQESLGGGSNNLLD